MRTHADVIQRLDHFMFDLRETLLVEKGGKKLDCSSGTSVALFKLWEVEDYTDLGTPCPRHLTIT